MKSTPAEVELKTKEGRNVAKHFASLLFSDVVYISYGKDDTVIRYVLFYSLLPRVLLLLPLLSFSLILLSL